MLSKLILLSRLSNSVRIIFNIFDLQAKQQKKTFWFQRNLSSISWEFDANNFEIKSLLINFIFFISLLKIIQKSISFQFYKCLLCMKTKMYTGGKGILSKNLSQKNAKNTKRGLPKFFDSPQNNLAKTLRTPGPPPPHVFPTTNLSNLASYTNVRKTHKTSKTSKTCKTSKTNKTSKTSQTSKTNKMSKTSKTCKTSKTSQTSS